MRYWLGLGSNRGDRGGLIAAALAWLREAGVEVEGVSAVYETAPREVLDQPPFLNAAARVRTPLDPPALLDLVKRMEAELGRAPGARYGPRPIDCDLLLWEGGAHRDERLAVPHERLAERRFALLPLLDLDPGLRLPDGRPIAGLLAAIDPREQPARRLGRGPGELG